MTTMADVPMHEKIQWLMHWDADCTVRIYYCVHEHSYEILFKHAGSDQWHEHKITDHQLRLYGLHDALTPLRTLLKITKP
jgi:hypothetical protein